MDFEQREDIDGVRCSWNQVPRSALQHQRNVVPLGMLYTPMNHGVEVTQAPAEAMTTCRQCQAFLNPYCRVDGTGATWTCAMCGFHNRLTPGQTIPLQATTVEYATGRSSRVPPVYVYVVDTCFEGDEDLKAFQALTDSVFELMRSLPEDALVGFISYGQNVQVHEVVAGATGVQKNWVFNGAKEYTLEEVSQNLGILDSSLRNKQPLAAPAGDSIFGVVGQRFLSPVATAEYQLDTIIQTLRNNAFPHCTKTQRLNRCTGAALNVASLLLRAVIGATNTIGGQILAYVGGACTYGPGMIVSQSLKDPIRSHHDIERQNTQIVQNAVGFNKPLTHEARKFYGTIAERLVAMGISVTLLIGSYDQVGLFEMEAICNRTGGDLVMCDLFDSTIFKQSARMVVLTTQLCLNATLEVRVGDSLGIQGLLGNATAIPLAKRENRFILQSIAKLGLGQLGTNCWKCCNVGPQSTYAIYLEKRDSTTVGQTYVQFIFHYQSPEDGQLRLRVTTIPLQIVQDNDIAAMEYGFDQETSLVLIARDLVHRLQAQEAKDPQTKVGSEDVVTLLDKRLIDFCARFAVYNKGDVNSFRLSTTYQMLPQFMYHLRRSQLVKVFNNSPDETSYVRHLFLHEDLTNSLTMIQPTLMSYDIDNYSGGEPEPVLLDSQSLSPGRILLLDTFFQVLIFHGSRVAQWRKAGYHEQEEYAYFKEFLEAPKSAAMQLLIERFPLPRFIDCDEGGSQARFLMAKLNPSTNYASHPNNGYGSGVKDVLTDDVSLQLFMEQVQKKVVAK